ncbi:hypothetical protein LCGC14_2722360 [marine sediment metagenome]|jgi:DNA-binding transcriptional ArsR family regulator|uniref:HTH arsR-type domain-containing protein n=1 Tax=marine sediment metagenome TaxID=412755 RepID=A0A0F8Z9V0_9ZZZZ|nr:ArsR family transcriptional regulator [Desulfobacterales bacterium]
MLLEPSEIFKVLGVETRVKIIELLKSNGPLGVKDISSDLGVTPSAISQHLKILKQAGLVRSERQGYWIPYSINEEAMAQCRKLLTEVCTCGCRGTGKFRETELSSSNLNTFKRYEEELVNELELIRQRIDEIETAKK